MGKLLARAFLLPGNTVCSALGVKDPEGRIMLRTLFNMLVWNVVAVVGVVLWSVELCARLRMWTTVRGHSCIPRPALRTNQPRGQVSFRPAAAEQLPRSSDQLCLGCVSIRPPRRKPTQEQSRAARHRQHNRERTEYMDQQQREPAEAPAADGKTRIVAQTPGLRAVEYVLHRRHAAVAPSFRGY
jgi:hypothetical protein